MPFPCALVVLKLRPQTRLGLAIDARARGREIVQWRRSFLETKTFAELGLSPKVQAAIAAAGYTTPTPIQSAAIPVAVTGRDVLGIAG